MLLGPQRPFLGPQFGPFSSTAALREACGIGAGGVKALQGQSSESSDDDARGAVPAVPATKKSAKAGAHGNASSPLKERGTKEFHENH
jgi:hypothetical protein